MSDIRTDNFGKNKNGLGIPIPGAHFIRMDFNFNPGKDK